MLLSFSLTLAPRYTPAQVLLWLLGFLRNDLGIFHATMIKRFKLGYEWSQYMKEVRLGFLRALSAAAVVALWSQCTQIGEIVEQKRKAFYIVWSPAFLTFWHSDDIIRLLEQNSWLHNKLAILFWRFHWILWNRQKLEKQVIDLIIWKNWISIL